ncbi:addiction module antidote protein [Undibacterium sp. Ji50W]|uniref:addiction module antidote protein n=1 Tax=Undibacterium sp. Ji50W TaxID=3413041 RepID=UPI003BF1C222
MKAQTNIWDVSDYLKTKEDQALYLDACIEKADGDTAFIAKALGDIARARGMSQSASDAGCKEQRHEHFGKN